MDPVNIKETVDVILTPHFYTFLREELAIKFVYKAKQIAPSLFDDYIDDTDESQYHVYKCDEDWCFFAYNINKITSFLKEKGIETHNIRKIYFAQELAPLLDTPIKLSEYDAMQTIQGVVTVIPSRLMSDDEQYQQLDLNRVTLQNGIAISSSLGSVVPTKQTVILTVLLTLLGATYIIEGNRTKSATANIEAKLNSLIEQNPKLGSSLIRNSELKKYKAIDKKERLKRDIVAEISKMLSKQSQIVSISINEKSVTATLRTQTKLVNSQIKKEAKRANMVIKSHTDKEITLEKSL